MITEATATVATPPYSRANPFPGKLVVNRRLSGPESEKDTRHFEIDLSGWGLTFEVGDSLAVYAMNDPQLVDEIIHALGATGDEQVPRLKGPPTARLRDHAADAQVFKSDHSTRKLFDAAERSAAVETQRRFRSISLGNGSD